MAKLRLTLACWNYDRTRALADGSVAPDGVDLNYLTLPVEETFFRMLRHREFEAAELSLSSYTVSLFRDDAPFIAIPVFPSRYFRHSCIYIHSGCGIREPRDLAGKRIGNPEYQMTAPAWIRGIMSDEYGVPVSSPTYFSGGEEQPGRHEKIALSLPPEIRTQAIPEDKTLSQMLETGEIDALYTARAPSCFGRSKNVARLFPDYAAVERQYYAKTRIFPIMHVIAIRRDVYRENPWVIQSLMKAFAEAQRRAYQDLRETGALKCMLPWLPAHVEETERIMGTSDFWPYGLEPNRHVLSTFLRYSFEQGLSKRQLQPEELFAPESLEAFKI